MQMRPAFRLVLIPIAVLNMAWGLGAAAQSMSSSAPPPSFNSQGEYLYEELADSAAEASRAHLAKLSHRRAAFADSFRRGSLGVGVPSIISTLLSVRTAGVYTRHARAFDEILLEMARLAALESMSADEIRTKHSLLNEEIARLRALDESASSRGKLGGRDRAHLNKLRKEAGFLKSALSDGVEKVCYVARKDLSNRFSAIYGSIQEQNFPPDEVIARGRFVRGVFLVSAALTVVSVGTWVYSYSLEDGEVRPIEVDSQDWKNLKDRAASNAELKALLESIELQQK